MQQEIQVEFKENNADSFRSAFELRDWPVPLISHQSDATLPYRIMRAPNKVRHVIFAAFSKVAELFESLRRGLTHVEANCPDRLRALNRISGIVRSNRLPEIITEKFGSCPPGYLGALARTRSGVQPAAYYRMLFDTFADPCRRSEARALQQLTEIDFSFLMAVRQLPEAMRQPKVVERVRDGVLAEKIAMAARLLADYHPLFQDPRQLRAAVSSSNDVRALVVRSVQRIDAPLRPAPIQLVGFRHIRSTAELRETGRRYRVCLAESWMVAACVSGQRAVFVSEKHHVLVEVGLLHDGRATLLGVAGAGNKRIARDVLFEVEEELRRQGLLRLDGHLLMSKWDVIEEIDDQIRREARGTALGSDDLFALLEAEAHIAPQRAHVTSQQASPTTPYRRCGTPHPTIP